MAIVVWAIGQKCGVQAGISRDVKQKGHGVVLEGKQRKKNEHGPRQMWRWYQRKMSETGDR